ncbi:hypothetical protein K492DRAFT_240110 [Lichtheimia hyalospora FSU 10163]|nr:hypothetical protein K492DRAFT_240110 [Lichtheimia hyalospora FSU 10163]
MPRLSIDHLQQPTRPILVTAFIALLMACWPRALQYIISTIQLVLTTILSLVVFNIFILFIYVKYFLSPSKQPQHDFVPLRFTTSTAWAAHQQQRSREQQSSSCISIAPEWTQVSDAFDELVSYVLRDFIDYWFAYVAGPHEQSFKVAIDRIIRETVLALKQRIMDADLFSILVNRLVPIMTQHIAEFRAAEISLRGKSLERSVTQSDELDLLLASQFRGGRLHPALTTAAVTTTRPTEVDHLRHMIQKILPLVHKDLSNDQGPVSVIIRELVSCAVLQPVLDMVADPDYWNQTIDSYLGKAIREQKMVRKLREVLIRHSNELDEMDENEIPTVPRSAPTSGKRANSQHTLVTMGSLSSILSGHGDDDTQRQREFGGGIKMGRRTFQEFLRMIEEEKNLLELKRVRNDIITQLRKKRAQIYDRDPEEVIDGEKVEDIIVYLNRLSVAKKRVDKRIGVLTGEHVATDYHWHMRSSTGGISPFFGSSRSRRKHSHGEAHLSQQSLGYSLHDILTNTSGLSYFMEFMDRRGDMMKLQFWLLVEGFKNSELMVDQDTTTERVDKTFFQDVNMVYSMYLEENAPHSLGLPKEPIEELYKQIQLAQSCIKDHDSDNLHNIIQTVRQQLYRIQQQVFDQLEKEHFPYFKRSDLYFKYLATTPNSGPDTAPERRSLDDLYQRPSISQKGHVHQVISASSSSSSTKSSINNNNSNNDMLKPRPLGRTASASMTRKKPWDDNAVAAACQKADSDTEVNDSTSKRKAVVSTSTSTPHIKSRSTHVRPSNHVRSPSETAAIAHGNLARFLNLSKMMGSANEWWQATSDWQLLKPKDTDSTSKRDSIRSFETDELDDVDEEDTTDNEQPPKRQPLLRSNTVEAVEAELQSIMDWEDGTATAPIAEDNKDTLSVQREPAKVLSAPPSPSMSKHALLGAQGAKSTTALPVQSDSMIESRRGSAVVQQVEHDALDQSDNKKQEPVSEQQEQGKSNVHLAPPGDLMLAAKVEKLSEEMDRLRQQEAIVDELIRKAEHDSSNKTDHIDTLLRILKKSKNMFRREMQQLKYQKSQYELQESENVLMPERSKVSITSSTIGSDQYGEFALYVIEIQQLGYDGNYGSGWIVARRYSEFFTLHQKLKERYSAVKLLDFPSKWPLLRLQKSFVEARRANLERYLRRLLEHEEICASQELRAFLSQQNVFVPGPKHQDDDEPSSEMGFFTSIPKLSDRNKSASASSSTIINNIEHLQRSSSSSTTASNKSVQPTAAAIAAAALVDNTMPSPPTSSSSTHAPIHNNDLHRKQSTGFMKHIYKTVAEGIDDLVVAPSMLDLIIQRMGDQVMYLFQENNPDMTASSSSTQGDPDKDMAAAAAAAAMVADLDDEQHTATPEAATQASVASEGITKFTEPLCDLFIEMFELKEKNNWLRRQAVVIILQQILGGTIERKLRETVNFLETEPMIVFYLKKITSSLWPDGKTLTFKPPRRPDEKQHTKEEANRKLSAWLPDLIGQMVGRQNARRGARRLFSVLQNKRLNQDLVYTLFDEIIAALFPELDGPLSSSSCKKSHI